MLNEGSQWFLYMFYSSTTTVLTKINAKKVAVECTLQGLEVRHVTWHNFVGFAPAE